MLTATQFWTEARREELREWKARGYFPSRLKRFKDSTNSGGTPIEKGPHAGFRFHEAWPENLNYMEAKRGGDKAALRCLDNHGWYTDSFQDGVVYACAVEVRIPRRKARREQVEHSDSCHDGCTRVRWMEATAHSDCDQILISRRSSDLHDTIEDCIRSADRVAECSAEEDREADQQYQADQQIDQAEHDIGEAQEVIELCKKELEAMRPCYHLIAEGVLVERIQQEQATIQKLQGRITLLQCEPWRAVA